MYHKTLYIKRNLHGVKEQVRMRDFPLWEWHTSDPVIEFRLGDPLVALWQQPTSHRRMFAQYRESQYNGKKQVVVGVELTRQFFEELIEQLGLKHETSCRCPKRGFHLPMCRYYQSFTLPDAPGATPGDPLWNTDEFAARPDGLTAEQTIVRKRTWGT